MSTKSDALRQENKKLRGQVAAFKKLVLRMDKGTAAIRDIALVYGKHFPDCDGTKMPSDELPNPVCTCQWDQAKTILTAGRPVAPQAGIKPEPAPAPAPAEAPEAK